jgi:hypothetical protein
MPLQRLIEVIFDRAMPCRMVGELRVFFQPGVATPDEMALITRKVAEALQLMRALDPANAEIFASTYRKVYVTSQPVLHATSSGAPKLPNQSLVDLSVPIVASFLLSYVPFAKVGLFRATWQLVDVVPLLITADELQIAFLRAAEPNSAEAQGFIRRLEDNIEVLRPQLRGA